ncbi:MAG: hypothetical protein ACLVJK_13160 [Alistipes putredinis]
MQKLILDASGQWTPLLEMAGQSPLPVSDLFSRVSFDPGESTSCCLQAFRSWYFQQEGNGRTAVCSRVPFAEKAEHFCGEQINLALRPVCVIFVPK